MYTDKLKQLEYRYGYKQKDAAEKLGISESLYSAYKKEKKIMPIKHLNNLCNFYHVSVDYILGLTEKIKYTGSKSFIDQTLMSQRLKEVRKENKITQEKLANILNIGNGTIAEYERGNYIISTTSLYIICQKYHVSADYLLGKIDNPKYLE